MGGGPSTDSKPPPEWYQTLARIQGSVLDDMHKKDHNFVLNMSMGLGKTCTTIKYSYVSTDGQVRDKNNSVLVFAPIQGIIESAWKKDVEKPHCVVSGLKEPEIKYRLTEEFLSGDVDLNKFDIVIFDEVHMVYDTFAQRQQQVLRKLRAFGGTVVGLTGTIVSESLKDFLMTMNIVMPPKLAPPLSVLDFQKKYYRVPYYEVLRAWVAPMMTTAFTGIVTPLYLAEIADFYSSWNPGGNVVNKKTYAATKERLVQTALRKLPLFQPRVFRDDFATLLATNNPIVYLSLVIYRMFVSPFGFLIPTIIFNLKVQERQDLALPDTVKLQRDFGDYVLTKMVEYKKEGFFAADPYRVKRDTRLDPAGDYESLYPRVRVHRRAVPYAAYQAETFVRFCLGKLTRRELFLLRPRSGRREEEKMKKKEEEEKREEGGEGEKKEEKEKKEKKEEEEEEEEEQFQRLRGEVTFSDLMDPGLDIGNLLLTSRDRSLIRGQNEAQVKDGLISLQVDTDTGTETGTGKDKKTGTGTGTGTDTETGAETGAETGTDKKTETDTETDTGTDTGTDKKTETGTDKKTETDTETKYIPQPKFDFMISRIAKKAVEVVGTPNVVIYSQFKDTEEKFTSYYKSKDDLKAKFEYLSGQQTTGIDGIKETHLMFIMEPLSSYGALQQLRARVARVGSHKNPRGTTVDIYELVSTVDWRTRLLRWRKKTEHRGSGVFYSLQKTLQSQAATPDEVVLKRQVGTEFLINSLTTREKEKERKR
jgi:hypothetical protein